MTEKKRRKYDQSEMVGLDPETGTIYPRWVVDKQASADNSAQKADPRSLPQEVLYPERFAGNDKAAVAGGWHF